MILRRRGFTWFSLLVLAAACSSDPSKPNTGTDPDAAPDLEDVVYVGGTTDEALERLVAVKAKDEPKQYVSVTAPNLDEPLSADSPATFEFHLASEAKHVPAPRLQPTSAPPPAWRRPLRELLQLFGPPRVAFAHGAPYNGTAYFLDFKGADGKHVLRVFSGPASYTPTAAAWQSLVAAQQPLTLDITSAFFEENNVPADGGPFVGGSFGFSIE